MATRTRTRYRGRPKTVMTTRLQRVPSRHDPSIASPFKIVTLPCLRCGNLAVPIIPVLHLKGRSASTFHCRMCDAEHYLSVTWERGASVVCYQRYTLRYPLEHYDEGVEPPIVTLHAKGHSTGESDNDIYAGPIVVYPRKRRFSQSEIEAIWQATKGHCHICHQRWLLNQRGMRGWHIDHVIPHIGGGRDTEVLPNFRVACAKCNLRKGKGFKEASIRLGLRRLVELLQEDKSP